MQHTKTDSDATSLTASSPPRSPPRRPVYYVQSPTHDDEKHITTISYHSTPALLSPCYVLGFVVCFLVLFFVFAGILYGAAKPQKPKLTLTSIAFERFMVQAGSDSTGVATDMVSMNSTVKFVFRNTATFFGLHVTSTPLELSFSQIAVGSGTMKKFYQSRKSQRLVTVSVIGDKIPMYGSGQLLKSSKGIPTAPVPLKLSFVVRSRGYVLGKLVKPKFFDRVECSVAFDPKKINVPMALKNNCKFL
ncbi:hypothetical protein HanIR_Chr05g0238471 [Helianthus annuus]|nr:hypothetical protein HanIR_Chr05g0238471 [Helianthus annuus]